MPKTHHHHPISRIPIPRPGRREVPVVLTVGQIEALEALLAYATEQRPNDVGVTPAQLYRLSAAWGRLEQAKDSTLALVVDA